MVLSRTDAGSDEADGGSGGDDDEGAAADVVIVVAAETRALSASVLALENFRPRAIARRSIANSTSANSPRISPRIC